MKNSQSETSEHNVLIQPKNKKELDSLMHFLSEKEISYTSPSNIDDHLAALWKNYSYAEERYNHKIMEGFKLLVFATLVNERPDFLKSWTKLEISYSLNKDDINSVDLEFVHKDFDHLPYFDLYDAFFRDCFTSLPLYYESSHLGVEYCFETGNVKKLF